MKIPQNLTFAEIEKLYWKTFTARMPMHMSYQQATEAVEKKLSPMEFSTLLAEIRSNACPRCGAHKPFLAQEGWICTAFGCGYKKVEGKQ